MIGRFVLCLPCACPASFVFCFRLGPVSCLCRGCSLLLALFSLSAPLWRSLIRGFRWCPLRSSGVFLLAKRVYFNYPTHFVINWKLKRTQATLTYDSQLGRCGPFGFRSSLFFGFLRLVSAFLLFPFLFLVVLLGCSATLMN